MEIGDFGYFSLVLRIAVSMSSDAREERERERDQFATRSESKFESLSEIYLVHFGIQKKKKTVRILFDAFLQILKCKGR